MAVKVTVLIITYNHEKFIAQAIESVLMQKTTFPIEILIGEDDSDDKTRGIVKKYAKKFPDRLTVFFNERKNVIYIDGRPTGRWNTINLLNHAKGKYVAFLEGDDYWTDSTKLQKQVEIMEKYPQVSICHHRAKVIFEDKLKPDFISHEHKVKQWGDFDDVITKRVYIMSPTQMFRRSFLPTLPDFFTHTLSGDYVLNAFQADCGPVYFIDKVMAIYRVHGGGRASHGGKGVSVNEMFSANINRLYILDELNEYFEYRHNETIQGCKRARYGVIRNMITTMSPRSKRWQFVLDKLIHPVPFQRYDIPTLANLLLSAI